VKITVKKGSLADVKTEAFILAFCEGKKALSGPAADIDRKSGGLLSDIIKSGDFEAKASEVLVIYTRGAVPAKRIALVGLGKKSELNLEKIRRAFAKAMQHLRGLKIKEAATAFDTDLLPDQKEKVVAAIVEGASLGLYQYTPYKTVGREEVKDLRQLEIIARYADYSWIQDVVQKTNIITDAVCFARDLVSAPANQMAAVILDSNAQKLAKK